MVWGGGLLASHGALDFAGGTVVHINAAIAGLVGAYLIGKRVGFGKEAFKPHNLPMVFTGTAILYIGWFGFNAGSAGTANEIAALAFVNTVVATAAAILGWIFGEWALRGKPSLLGACSGAIAGLVGVTPACGYIGVGGALIIGVVAQGGLGAVEFPRGGGEIQRPAHGEKAEKLVLVHDKKLLSGGGTSVQPQYSRK
jgi:Amt family ammonium transporter